MGSLHSVSRPNLKRKTFTADFNSIVNKEYIWSAAYDANWQEFDEDLCFIWSMRGSEILSPGASNDD